MYPSLRKLALAAAALTAAAYSIHHHSYAGVSSAVLHAAARQGIVRSLSIQPADGRTDVVIGLDGEVAVHHFTLSGPHRIVVDFSGATLGLPVGAAYDQVSRGGITAVRYSQFSASVVRVALQLDASRAYTLTRKDGEVRVSVESAGAEFPEWRIGARGAPLASIAIPDDAVPAVQAGTPSREPEPPVPAERAVPAGPARPDASANVPLPQPFSTNSRPGAVASQQPSQQPRISVVFDNMPISEILRTFANFSGRNILAGTQVRGNFTGDILNLPWDVALRGILNAMGYDAFENPDGIIIVDTFEALAQKTAAMPLGTRTVRLNYARAVDVAAMVDQRLTRDCPRPASPSAQPAAIPGTTVPTPPGGVTDPGVQAAQPQFSIATPLGLNCPKRGTVLPDTLTNSIHIIDIPPALDELEQFARSLDLRPAQVNIRAKIMLVDRTNLEALGLRYDLGNRFQFFNDIVPRIDSLGAIRTDAGQVSLGGNSLAAIANASLRVPSATVQMVYSTAIGGFDLTAFLEAMQQTNILDVQAEPSVNVLNNRTATLTSGVETPLRAIDAGAAGAGAEAPRATVNLKQTGLILQVTPSVTNNRQVQMRLHIENSDVNFAGVDAQSFPTQKGDTEIIVADGETAVIGGVAQTSVRYSRTGIPFLVDLPIIGRLFGVTQRQETKRDLLLLITPHIIDEGQQTLTGPPPQPESESR